MRFLGSRAETPLRVLPTGYLNIDGEGRREDGKGLRCADIPREMG
jgi:hypothetical protein